MHTTPLTPALQDQLCQALDAEGVGTSWFLSCCEESRTSDGETLVAVTAEGRPAGFATLLARASYPEFARTGIPEVHGMAVLPSMRRQGIGRMLLAAVEEKALEKGFSQIGLGVGITKDYQAALTLYMRAGYLPDGRGLYHMGLPGQFASYGDNITIDTSTSLWFIRNIGR